MGIKVHYTVIVSRVRGMFPFVNSLGLDRDHIYKSRSSSGVSQWVIRHVPWTNPDGRLGEVV